MTIHNDTRIPSVTQELDELTFKEFTRILYDALHAPPDPALCAIRPEKTLYAQEKRLYIGYVYLVQMKVGRKKYYKIGRTHDLQQRFTALYHAVPFEIKLIHSFATYNSVGDEAELHSLYAEYQVKGEWFLLPTCAVEHIKSIPSRTS